MLKFLYNRPDEASTSATKISRQPSHTYGISMESPPEFSNKHTMMHTNSHINPHFRYEEGRVSKMSTDQKNRLASEWTRKTNLNLIEVRRWDNLGGKSDKSEAN